MAMKLLVAMTPKSQSKFPYCVNSGAHPLFWGEIGSRFAGMVIYLNGGFPCNGNVAAEELIPTNLSLGFESTCNET
jgi:hypothetical protein